MRIIKVENCGECHHCAFHLVDYGILEGEKGHLKCNKTDTDLGREAELRDKGYPIPETCPLDKAEGEG